MQFLKGEEILAGYRLGAIIGIGTYGEVRYAQHMTSGKRVALKIVDLSRFRDDTASLVIKEIRILKMMKHKHCIRILEVQDNVPYCGTFCDNCACSTFQCPSDDDDGNAACLQCGHSAVLHSDSEKRNVLVIVQELAAGGELFGLIMPGGPFQEDLARYYFRQLISGIEYCHSQGVIHRDLKPENLVLDARFRLKIVDFGLAALSGEQGGVLHSGVGSQPYSAPEVYYSKELYGGCGYRGEPADIWSAAVILFVMLTGRPPFVRPLAKTYSPSLRRCKHFTNLLKGVGFGDISQPAKTMLMRMFRLNPYERLTIDKLKNEPWFNGPLPSPDILDKLMEEKARKVWMSQDKTEVCYPVFFFPLIPFMYPLRVCPFIV